MDAIIKVLMERDGFSYEDALDEYKAGMEMVMSSIEDGDYEAAEMDFMDNFGLESDYLMDALCF